MDEGNKAKQTMKMVVRGTQVNGRPRMRLMDDIRHDMNKCGVEEGDAQYRNKMDVPVQNPDLGPRLKTFFEHLSVLNSQSVLRNYVTLYALAR